MGLFDTDYAPWECPYCHANLEAEGPTVGNPHVCRPVKEKLDAILEEANRTNEDSA